MISDVEGLFDAVSLPDMEVEMQSATLTHLLSSIASNGRHLQHTSILLCLLAFFLFTTSSAVCGSDNTQAKAGPGHNGELSLEFRTEVAKLSRQSAVLTTHGNFAEALAVHKKVCLLFAKELGPNNWQTIVRRSVCADFETISKLQKQQQQAVHTAFKDRTQCDALFTRRRFRKAARHISHAKDALRTHLGTRSMFYMDTAYKEGVVFMSTGDFSDAARSFQEAIRAAKRLYGTSHLLYGKYTQEYAWTQMKLKRYEVAKRLLKDASKVIGDSGGKRNILYWSNRCCQVINCISANDRRGATIEASHLARLARSFGALGPPLQGAPQPVDNLFCVVCVFILAKDFEKADEASKLQIELAKRSRTAVSARAMATFRQARAHILKETGKDGRGRSDSREFEKKH